MKLNRIIFILIIFGIYLFTCYPTIPPYRDSGDLISSSYTLGISHPPGYPFYNLVGKIFSVIIPFGNIAYRINFMSIFFSVLSFFMICYLFNFTSSGIITALVFCLTKSMWALTHVSEMYTMSIFVIVFLFLIQKKIHHFKQEKYFNIKFLYLFSFISGLGLNIHPSLVFILPGFIFWFYFFTKEIINKKTFFYILIFFILGLSVQFYIPLRSLYQPVLNWGDASKSINNWFRLITRADYGGLKLHPEQSKFIWNFNIILSQIKLFFYVLIEQFSIIMVIIGLIGFYYSYKNKTLIITLSGFIFTGILFFILSNLPIREESTLAILEPHFLLPGVIFSILIGYTISSIKTKFYKIFLIFICLYVCGFLFLKNFKTHNNRNNFFAYDYGKNILKTLDNNSILYDTDDPTTFIITYFKICEKKRRDIKLLNYFRTKWGADRIIKYYPDILPFKKNIFKSSNEFIYSLFEYNIDKRKIFTDIATKSFSNYNPVCYGLLYLITKKEQSNRELTEILFNNIYIYRGMYNIKFHNEFFTKRILYYYSSSHNNIGLEYAKTKNFISARKHYEHSLNIDPYLVEAWNNLGTLFYSQGDYNQAIKYFEKAIKLKPDDYTLYYNLGLTYKQMNNLTKAEEIFNSILKTYYSPQIMNELGVVLLDRGNYERSIEIFKELLNKTPQYYLAYYNLALAYQKNNDFINSINCYKKYLLYINDQKEKLYIENIIKNMK